MADAHGSGPCARKGVQVQVLSPVLAFHVVAKVFVSVAFGREPRPRHLPNRDDSASAFSLPCIAALELGLDGPLHSGLI